MSRDKLERALGYPYPIPEMSYIVDNGETLPLNPMAAEAFRRARTPVLAVGSNQSPEQIARKFQGPGWGGVACEKCTLDHFDTVYSAHVTAYGSIAAALHPSPGTRVNLFVNWLTDAQLLRMHETELGNENYVYAHLSGIKLETELGHILENVHFYRGNQGAYSIDGNPIPLSEVAAEARRWRSLSQKEMQDHLHAEHEDEHPFDAFVLRSIDDAGHRTARRQRMQERALPFRHAGVRVLIEKL